MRNVSHKSSRDHQNQFYYNLLFFFENLAIYEIMWKNTVEPGRPQMAIWCMPIAGWIPKATNTHSEYKKKILLFHCKNGCMKAPQCYVAHQMLVLLLITLQYLGL
jgi:hypothetical protein